MPERIAIPLLAAVAALTLGGCSLLGLGDDFEDLEPGTFRFRADGRTYTGVATYHPNTDTDLPLAAVILTPDRGFVEITTDRFLTAYPGDRLEPSATLDVGGPLYVRESGAVEIISASGDHVEGRFQFRFRGWNTGGILVTEGGFHALLDNG
jgi:hypothetical protein